MATDGGIRILVVDDSPAMRSILRRALAGIEGVGPVRVAADGLQALTELEDRPADVVILDLEMPGPDGLDVLRRIRERDPELPVIMFSASTTPGSRATLDALMLGATDYVEKPRAAEGSASVARVRETFGFKLRALGIRRREMRELDRQDTVRPPLRPNLVGERLGRIDVVVIGCSTGGPVALRTIVPDLPGDLPVPVVVAQHMPAQFTRQLAVRLDRDSRISVSEAENGAVPAPGHVYLAPGDSHVTFVERAGRPHMKVRQGPPVGGVRPSADLLFSSAAEAFGDTVLGVVLTGMGRDGTAGCRDIRAAGGQVVVQDEATSVVWSMPGSVVAAGLSEKILPVWGIGREIIRRSPRAA